MVSITDDSGTHTKCLLGLFNEKADQLESAAREVDWERELTLQLMVRGELRVDEITYSSHDRLRWSSGGDCWLVKVRAGTRKVEKSNDLVTYRH